MRIALSHPGTPSHAQQAALAYLEEGLLHRYFTTFAYDPDTALGKTLRGLYRLASKDAENQLRRRELADVLKGKVSTHPLRELARILSSRALSSSAQDLVWDWMELDFDRHVASLDWNGSTLVHGYEYASLKTFQEARRRGSVTLYEMPAPYFKTVDRIVSGEFAKFPSLQTPYRSSLLRRSVKRNFRKEQELALADLVLCNSTFTRRSLEESGFPESRIIVLPLGFPDPVEVETSEEERRLRFLYAGNLNVQKGAHCLLEAWRRLAPGEDVELHLAGSVNLPDSLLRDLPGRVEFHGSLPKAELAKLYLGSSLLVFPTLCDGFGMVLTEALAHGLPVLTTSNAGSSDFIEPGRNGFVVSPGRVEELLETLRWCIQNPHELLAMRRACLETARCWQWSDYRRKLASEVKRRVCAMG